MKHILFLILILSAQSGLAATLGDVQQRGELRCGVNTGLPGFSERDGAGNWQGFDVDFCRAVAAAVLGDPGKVEYVPLTTSDRFEAVADRKVDVLSRNTTWTLERDASSGARFVGISYYDGQGFMIRKAAGVRSALGLGGMSVCVQKDTTSRDHVERYFAVNRMPLQLVEVASPEAMLADYREGKCDLVTSDQSQLYALRSRMEQQGDHRILPEVISREPLGPAVRAGDDQWATIVRWVLYALIEAEQRDLNSGNVDRVRDNSTYPVVRWMLGSEGNVGDGLGLDADWVYRVISSVGNYAEVFDRNLGSASALKIKRGLNAPWIQGGLLYSPPFK